VEGNSFLISIILIRRYVLILYVNIKGSFLTRNYGGKETPIISNIRKKKLHGKRNVLNILKCGERLTRSILRSIDLEEDYLEKNKS